MQDDDDMIDLGGDSGDIFLDHLDCTPSEAGGIIGGIPPLDVKAIAGFDGDIDITQEGEGEAVDFFDVGGTCGRSIFTCSDMGDAPLIEQAHPLNKRFWPVVKGVVVGEGDEVKAAEPESGGGFWRRLEAVAFARCRFPYVAKGAFKVADGVVGRCEIGAHRGERVGGAAVVADDGAECAGKHNIADGREVDDVAGGGGGWFGGVGDCGGGGDGGAGRDGRVGGGRSGRRWLGDGGGRLAVGCWRRCIGRGDDGRRGGGGLGDGGGGGCGGAGG